MGWIMRIAGLTLITLLASAAAAQARTQTGYLAMPDGSQLKYTAQIPAGTGPFPVALTFDGYAAGVSGGLAPPISGTPAELVAHGYVALGVNVPGTGCSTGAFDFFSPDWAQDGADVVEWTAHQSWSDGKVAMIGHSFSGFASYFAAAQRPPGLVAIAPASTDGDFYRDTVYAGAIYNIGLANAFLAGQQSDAVSGVLQATAAGDTGCALNFALHLPSYVLHSTSVVTAEHPYDD
ncbi:MAG TPA: CocE/NonD family hydrolase, partial [Chloroflexota bacterium]